MPWRRESQVQILSPRPFREAFPNLKFWGAADLIAEGAYVVGRWEGGGTHTGPAFTDLFVGSLPAATSKKMRFHRNDFASDLKRADHSGNRSGRWRDCPHAAWSPIRSPALIANDVRRSPDCTTGTAQKNGDTIEDTGRCRYSSAAARQ